MFRQIVPDGEILERLLHHFERVISRLLSTEALLAECLCMSVVIIPRGPGESRPRIADKKRPLLSEPKGNFSKE